jgi:glycosyltransferase involved in cell wall biosynthesis
MRILIDMQGAQSTGSRLRGIGRYTQALIKEMVRLSGEHEVILALNGLFPETIEPIRAAFVEHLPANNIHVWEAVGSVNATDPSNNARRQAAEITREAFLASLDPDIVLTTSLFEGLVDDAITSIGTFTSRIPTAVILYDLIPLIHRNVYLQNETVERWYLNKLDHLRRANLLLSISASSRQEALDYLGFPPTNVVNISTACDSHFKPIEVDDARRIHLQKTYGLVRPFVMYTGGIDHRKNIEGLIHAYASLPKQIRSTHQLAVVCSIQTEDRKRLHQLAKTRGLGGDELVITGFVAEEDLLALYNLCKMFVFPSWHEGFGLPALEAMACGRAVIGANTSSVPEVIDREDALFDPYNDDVITRKIEEVLTNDLFRSELERHGREQAKKFSWEQTALRAWQALEAFVAQRSQEVSALVPPTTSRRLRLAYISPLPPAQSGIADYSAALLPELSRHYKIEIIIAQDELIPPWVHANCPIRTIEWFRCNAHRFDRVLYQFGNSAFHSHMFDLLDEFPGVVVLHDFFLSGIVAHMEIHSFNPNGWSRALLCAHGWAALHARYKTEAISDVIMAYPCNLSVLQQALGVIVHSDNSCRLARQWYGANTADDWSLIPILRIPVLITERETARHSLGLLTDDFIICSFGHLGPSKLNHLLLEAWLASPLADDPHCRLVFVGQNHSGAYGNQLLRNIRESRSARRIEITGWTDAAAYQAWLAAVDVGVQLRTLSRGETSAAVLDCMNHGLATIVNAHGSMADLPADAVWRLTDEFLVEELIEALTTLWRNGARRDMLGQRAREVILTRHQPRQCAEQYADAIENYYQTPAQGGHTLIDAIASVEPTLDAEDWSCVATSLASNFPPRPRRKQLLLDISELVQCNMKSDIQLVVRSLLRELLFHPFEGYVIEPVYAGTKTPGYRYARRFTSRFLDIDDAWAEDEVVEAWQGDIFLGLDNQPHVVSAQQGFYQHLRHHGVKVIFVVYDLLCISHPLYFAEAVVEDYCHWLEVVAQSDGAVCISHAVANELADWQREHGPKRLLPFKIDWFHLGADVEHLVPTTGVPVDADQTLNALRARPSFLMVGTVEPRKGNVLALAAFDQLWLHEVDANLVIVGNQGWMVEALVDRLSSHPEQNKRLFWLEGISDEYLEKVYDACTCLIAASEGEGFDLPLIEAAHHKIPIIARDIPVFREAAGDHATYFSGLDPQTLEDAVKNWLNLFAQGKVPRSDDVPRLTWRESAQQLLNVISIE